MSYLAIYLIGCLLSFGRIHGSFFQIDEDYGDGELRWWHYKPAILCLIIMVLCSWMGFLAGAIVYWHRKDKYFFKWSLT